MKPLKVVRSTVPFGRSGDGYFGSRGRVVALHGGLQSNDNELFEAISHDKRAKSDYLRTKNDYLCAKLHYSRTIFHYCSSVYF